MRESIANDAYIFGDSLYARSMQGNFWLTLKVLAMITDAQWEGMGDVRVGEVRATSPMPDHKCFKLQLLVNFQKISTVRVKIQVVCSTVSSIQCILAIWLSHSAVTANHKPNSQNNFKDTRNTYDFLVTISSFYPIQKYNCHHTTSCFSLMCWANTIAPISSRIFWHFIVSIF